VQLTLRVSQRENVRDTYHHNSWRWHEAEVPHARPHLRRAGCNVTPRRDGVTSLSAPLRLHTDHDTMLKVHERPRITTHLRPSFISRRCRSSSI
jgi:hypothetical protein